MVQLNAMTPVTSLNDSWTTNPEEDGFTLDEQVVEDADDLVSEMTSLLYNPDATTALAPFYGPEGIRHEKYSGQILSVELSLDKMIG